MHVPPRRHRPDRGAGLAAALTAALLLHGAGCKREAGLDNDHAPPAPAKPPSPATKAPAPTRDPGPPPPRGSYVSLFYTSNLEGEYEPCG